MKALTHLPKIVGKRPFLLRNMLNFVYLGHGFGHHESPFGFTQKKLFRVKTV